MKSFGIMIMFLSLILGASQACRVDAENPIVGQKSGIKTITNPEYPREGRFTARLTEEMSFGQDTELPQAGLSHPVFFEVDAEGNVYVMDSGDGSIKFYDCRGRYFGSVGQPGQGLWAPRGPVVWFCPMAGKRLCVLDIFPPPEVTIISLDGRILSRFPLEGNYTNVRADDTGCIVLSKREFASDDEELTEEEREAPCNIGIYRVDSSDSGLIHLADFAGEYWVRKRSGSRGGVYVILWTVSPDGRLFGGYNGEYRISVFDKLGNNEMIFSRQFEFVRNPNFHGRVGQRETEPVFRDMLIDDKANIWLDLYQDDDAAGYLYDVFSPDGIYRRQVAADLKIGRIRNGKVFSLALQTDGTPVIKRYGMDLLPMSLDHILEESR